ncbi:MAG: glutamate 5-kinase [Actinomycetota bacterium]
MSNQELIGSSKRVVIKVGSSSITGANEPNLDRIVDLAVRLKNQGKEVIVVSSGAIATAAPLIGLAVKSEDLATSQALASIGQAKLMSRYERSLARHSLMPGQILLTVDNLDEPVTRENALRALERLLEIGVIPVINENDSVATNEIRFGDNDQLAAQVALLAKADLLVLLSDIDALYTRPPSEPGAQPIAVVEAEDDLASIEISGTSTGYGTGGAVTKLAAAKLASLGGTGVILTAAANVDSVDSADVTHTWFKPLKQINK